MSFGQRLKELREQNNMTRDELGKRLGMSYSTIAKYETNNRFPDQDTLVKLAGVFDVSVDHLLGNDKPRVLPETVAPYLADGLRELTPEARKEVMDFIEYVRVKYAKKDGDDKK